MHLLIQVSELPVLSSWLIKSTIKLHQCISLSTNVSCRKEAPRLTPGHVSHRSLSQIRNHRFSGQGTYSPKSLPFSYSAPGCLCLICLSATSWSLLCVLTVANYLSLSPPPKGCFDSVSLTDLLEPVTLSLSGPGAYSEKVPQVYQTTSLCLPGLYSVGDIRILTLPQFLFKIFSPQASPTSSSLLVLTASS